MSLRESSGTNVWSIPGNEFPITHYNGAEERPLVQVPQAKLPEEFINKQMVSWKWVDEADLTFLQDVMSVNGCPKYNGYMTGSSREQDHALQETTKVLYLPLLNLKHSDESTMLNGMLKAVDLRKAAGQEYVVLTLDQQLYHVALHVLRLGGMHLLMSFVSASSTLLNESGENEVLGDVFAVVTKMLSCKKFPYNVRALRMLVEEVLHLIIFSEKQDITCMTDLQAILDQLSKCSRSSKLCGLTVSFTLSSLFWSICMQRVRETVTFTYNVLRQWPPISLLVCMCTTLAMHCTIFAHLTSSLLMPVGTSKLENMPSTTTPEFGTEFGHIWQSRPPTCGRATGMVE